MFNELVKQMKDKGFDISHNGKDFIAVYLDTDLGTKRICYIYSNSLKVVSDKYLYEEEEKELRRVRTFISKFKKLIDNK